MQETTLFAIEKFKEILDALGDAVSIQDRNYVILYQNNAHRELIGDQAGKLCHVAYEKQNQPCRDCPLTMTFMEGGTHLAERSAPTAAGPLNVEITASPLHDDQGNIIAGIEIVRNITTRKNAENALEEIRKQYHRITEAVTDYFYTVKIEGGRAVKTVHSPACVGVTGYTAEEFAADPYLWIQMVLAEDRDAVREQVAAVLHGKEVKEIEHRIIRKDGEERWVRDVIAQHRAPDGTLLSYDGIVKDITTRKHLEMEREKIIKKLQEALDEIKTLRGIIPICAHCKQIRDVSGSWKRLEEYIETHSEAEFSHGICPDCAKKHYPDFFDKIK